MPLRAISDAVLTLASNPMMGWPSRKWTVTIKIKFENIIIFFQLTEHS